MGDLVIIKLGGSLITDKSKPFTAKPSVIRRLGKEIMSAQKAYKGKIIVVHGSGSFGHSVAAKYQTQEGIINKKSIEGFPKVADAAVQINRIVVKAFLKIGLPAVSFSPFSFVVSSSKKPKKYFIDPIKQALDIGLLPVLYGDVIMDKDIGFCIYSGEKVISILSTKLRKNFDKIRVIYCGKTNGVLDQNGKTIPVINDKVFSDMNKSISGSKAPDVTGGMLHKVKESLLLSKKGVDILIVGDEKGGLYNSIRNKKVRGTLIKSLR